MIKETTKPEEDIDPEAIARWNNEGGAPRPLTRGAGRLWPPDAVEEYRATLVQRDSVIHWPVPKIETDEQVGRHQRQQLENGIAGKAACTSDPSENERNRLALCPVAQENRIAGVSSDLWRFSCDAPHLCNS
jgi:hypothetical protein